MFWNFGRFMPLAGVVTALFSMVSRGRKYFWTEHGSSRSRGTSPYFQENGPRKEAFDLERTVLIPGESLLRGFPLGSKSATPWKGFRRALNKEDQEVFDRLFDRVKFIPMREFKWLVPGLCKASLCLSAWNTGR